MPGEIHRDNPVAAIDKRWCHAPPAVRRSHHAVKQNRNAVALPPFTNMQFHAFTLAEFPVRVSVAQRCQMWRISKRFVPRLPKPPTRAPGS